MIHNEKTKMKIQMDQDQILRKPMELRTFYNYMNGFYREVAMKKTQEDCCDTCIRINTEMKRSDITDEEKELLVLCLTRHDETSRTQRKLMHAAEAWGAKNIIEPSEHAHFLARLACIPEYVDDGLVEVTDAMPKSFAIEVEAHDYGGNIPLPVFNKERPAKDYYSANLSMYCFTICNLSRGENKILIYDERSQVKIYFHFEIAFITFLNHYREKTAMLFVTFDLSMHGISTRKETRKAVLKDN